MVTGSNLWLNLANNSMNRRPIEAKRQSLNMDQIDEGRAVVSQIEAQEGDGKK
jgi:hypothetical protein